MASLGVKLNNIRKNKMAKVGQKRKKHLKNKGTTPKFAIHPDKKK